MKLLRFVARGLNGFLNLNLAFDSRINFLIGINGSGKTTALRAITSLIGPDIDWLFSAKYDQISLEFQLAGVVSRISAIRSDSSLSIEYHQGDQVVASTVISDSYYEQLGRQHHDYAYRDDGDEITLSESSTRLPVNDQIFRLIKQLPTPIYLGLDRTTLPAWMSPRESRHRLRRLKRPRATLRAFLDESVAQAESLVGEALVQAQRRRAIRAAKLRENILLSMFSKVSQDEDNRGLPKIDDIRKYEKYRRTLKAAFAVMGLERTLVETNVEPFFQDLIDVASKLKDFTDLNDIFNRPNESNAQAAFFQWAALRPRLVLISHVERLISTFNKEEVEIFRQIKTYTDVMNSFFDDSNKLLSVSDDGEIGLKIPSQGKADIFHLSSGERQLFVLITNLMFNRDSKQANILIIDEPELSLHIKWQEMFVESLEIANDQTQMILATHSPSIILDREDRCIQLG